MEFPSWINEQLERRTIPNYSFETLKDLFHVFPIPLHEYDLLVTGYDKNRNKKIFLMRLLATRHERYFQGAHYIHIFHGKYGFLRFWASSLTNFRHGYQEYQDHVSFERSTYLLIPQHQKLVRLKCIRGLITLPIVAIGSQLCHHYSKEDMEKIFLRQNEEPESLKIHTYLRHEKKKSVCLRTQMQVKRCIQVLITSYLRELDGVCSREDIFDQFEQQIQTQIRYYQQIGI